MIKYVISWKLFKVFEFWYVEGDLVLLDEIKGVGCEEKKRLVLELLILR